MSNFRDVWGGFIIMISFCLFGVVLALAGGLVLDEFLGHFDKIGYLDNANPEWTEGGTWSNLFTTVNLYYFVCFLFPIIGIAAFVKSVIASQGYDQYLET